MHKILIICMFFVIVFPNQVFAIPLAELRNILSAEQNVITTAHFVYIEERTNNQPITGKQPGTDDFKIEAAYKYVLVEADIYLDRVNKKVKAKYSDLRDINNILVDYDIPDITLNRLNLSASATRLYQDNYTLSFNQDSKSLLLRKLMDNEVTPLEFLNYGIIPVWIQNIMSEGNDVKLSETILDGKPILRVEFTTQMKAGKTNWIVECDPAIGYRFKTIRRIFQGHTLSELIANNYKEVNGIPYPFEYTDRSFFYPEETIKYESQIHIEQAQFGISFTKADFKIFVPEGVSLVDAAISNRVGLIGYERYIDIDSALVMGKNALGGP